MGVGEGLAGKNILLGISGGIAAYKSPGLVRELIRLGADVRVAITEGGLKFVSSTTLETLSRHPVHAGTFESSTEFPVLHVGLAEWADLMLVAPATANLIGKTASGLGDDLLTTILLTYVGPTIMAPAMEENMWRNPSVQENVQTLRERGVRVLEPEEGELASGAVGKGRMPEPDLITREVVKCLGEAPSSADLRGLRLLVTAGPTVEDIDPVRFIGNRSSGKMGYAIAQRARDRGAAVCLVSGPTNLTPPADVRLLSVRSTREMQEAIDTQFEKVDGAILAAAVADYRVEEVAEEKIKRGGTRTIDLVENPDIAAALGRRRKHQILVGFAMETDTDSGLDSAREKLRQKNLDLIALNNVREEGAGFGVDTNIVTIIDADGRVEQLGKMSKLSVADRLLDKVRDLTVKRA